MYSFSTNALLRDQYELFQTKTMRLGLLLEDLDTFAGDIAARHAGKITMHCHAVGLPVAGVVSCR